MKISNRMLITFGAIYIVASIIIVALVNYDMRQQALIEAESKALMLINHNLAIHNYLQGLKPKLFSWSEPFRPPDYFEPAWMSSTYAIRQMNQYFTLLEKSKYYYKECAINARTAENEADPHERVFLEQLALDPKLVERSEVQTLNGQPVFVIMRRGLTMEKACLRCHSTPDRAPGDLVKIYGPTRSFGRREGEVVHAISIRIPLAEAYGQANRLSLHLSGILLALLGCLFASQTVISKRWLFDPMAALRQKALEIAASEARLGETIPVPPGPELRDLTTAFNTMSINLRQSHDSLEERVRERTADLNRLNERLEQDILQRQQAEEALRQSQEKLLSIFRAAPVGIGLVINRVIQEANEALCRMTGYDREELVGQNARMLYPTQEDYDYVGAEKYRQIVQRGTGTVETRWQRQDGEIMQIILSSTPLDATDLSKGVTFTALDITERQQAEEALRQSEQEYRLLVNQIPAMVFKGYSDWSIDPLDEKVEVLTGYSKEDFESRRIKWCDLIPAEDLDYAAGVFLEALKTTKSYMREHRLRRKDGEIIWVQCRGQIFCNDQGKVDYISGVSFDVTQRRQAEEALRESEIKYRLLAENVIDVIWTMDLNLNFTFASPSCEFLSGYSDKEIVGMRLDQLLSPDSVDLCKKSLAELLSPENLARQESPHFFLPQLKLRLKDGSRSVDIEVKGSVLMDSQGQPMGIVGVTRDITERKQLEEQFLQAQRMEAVGTLAGGIAHDFNNILTAILGNIGLAVLEDKAGPRVQNRLAQAEEACLRAQALSQQLLTFAKGGAPVKKLFSVAELLTESTAFSCVGSAVKCETTFPENLWSIEADPGQIGQVFQNITINAIQAMPTGGTIKVWAENLTLGTESDLPLSAGRYIKISVRDQGMGIPAEHLPRIFDPYFTTKQKGSGLGLGSAYAIINKHHGHIAVESSPGVGTTFYIYLPAVDQQVTPQPAEDRELLVGKGKILVMDDEEMVREVLGRILARLGYEAEFARDGGEAIDRFVQAHGFEHPFAAVILDLTVPGAMGGKETLARLLEIDPQVKAIVSSGYADDPIMANFQKYGFSGVIAKPYRVVELSKILQGVITTMANKR